MKLAEFDCEIIYKKGSENITADAFSRNPLEKEWEAEEVIDIPTFMMTACPYTEDYEATDKIMEEVSIEQFQAKDEECLRIMQHLPEELYFVFKNGVLCRISASGRHRLVVPAILKASIIEAYHSNKFSGHLGINKLYDKLKKRYYWHNMERDIRQYVNTCLGCRVHKAPKKKRPGLLHPINPFTQYPDIRAGDFISCDLVGPLPVSQKGNRYICVITDYATRFALAGGIQKCTALDVAEFIIDRWICQFGGFRVLLSDNGTCYRAQLMKELGRGLGFQQKFTTPINPAVNGLVERFNGTLAMMLKTCLPRSMYSNWDGYIAPLVFAYNSSLQKSIHEVPYYLMYGRDPLLPQDVAFNLPLNNLSATHLVERMRVAFETVQNNLEKSQAKDKARFDEKRSPSNIRIGDTVLYEYPIREVGVPDKLQPFAKGPYRVVARIGDLNALIEPLVKVPGKKSLELVTVRKLHVLRKANGSEELSMTKPESNGVARVGNENSKKNHSTSRVSAEHASRKEVEEDVADLISFPEKEYEHEMGDAGEQTEEVQEVPDQIESNERKDNEVMFELKGDEHRAKPATLKPTTLNVRRSPRLQEKEARRENNHGQPI